MAVMRQHSSRFHRLLFEGLRPRLDFGSGLDLDASFSHFHLRPPPLFSLPLSPAPFSSGIGIGYRLVPAPFDYLALQAEPHRDVSGFPGFPECP